jgi:hypothetical protein
MTLSKAVVIYAADQNIRRCCEIHGCFTVIKYKFINIVCLLRLSPSSLHRYFSLFPSHTFHEKKPLLTQEICAHDAQFYTFNKVL